MDTVFRICVEILKVVSSVLGISYQALNVWIFVIIHPSITLYLWYLYKKEKKKQMQFEVLKKK
jgi:hypothetical protein